jgi:hypothetical protein
VKFKKTPTEIQSAFPIPNERLPKRRRKKNNIKKKMVVSGPLIEIVS